MGDLSELFINKGLPILLDSVSLYPRNKSGGLTVDNLSTRSGFIPNKLIWYANDHDLQDIIIDDRLWDTNKKSPKSCVKIYDPANCINELCLEDKIAKQKELHYKMQDVISEAIEKMLIYIPSKGIQQAELSRQCGLSLDPKVAKLLNEPVNKFNENNDFIYTLAEMSAKQGIVKIQRGRSKLIFPGNLRKFEIIEYIPYEGKQSKQEAEFATFLNSSNTEYISQKMYSDCKHIKTLPFDFLVKLEQVDVLVEIQGQQHTKFIKHFHRTEDGFKLQQKRDMIKKEYAREKEILLCEIQYNENVRESFLQFLQKHEIDFI